MKHTVLPSSEFSVAAKFKEGEALLADLAL